MMALIKKLNIFLENMFNQIHQLYFSVLNKIRREKRKYNLKKIPKQKFNYLDTSKDLLFDPIIFSPEYIYQEAIKSENNFEIIKFLDQISEPDLEFFKSYYKLISNSHNKYSSYIDLIKILHVISKLIKPENYLEVGVRRGRSLSIVGKNSPSCNMYGFDQWSENYAGLKNTGPEIAIERLKKVNHHGDVNFFSGDSKYTIPQFKKKITPVYFDMITIDGDHTYAGAKKDLLNVIDILKIGGYLIFDDTNSFEHPYLKDVWKKIVISRDNFITNEFNEHGLGVSIGVRLF